MIVSSQTCTVGSQYEPYTELSSIPEGWYLNLQLPATCSGNVTGYTAFFYDASPLFRSIMYVAMWTPLNGSTGYEKV